VWLLDFDTAEAAEALGIVPGTVRKQLELARADLRVGTEG
jgi:DNA-directed RNA polymerase specialized sigma24 family protein